MHIQNKLEDCNIYAAHYEQKSLEHKTSLLLEDVFAPSTPKSLLKCHLIILCILYPAHYMVRLSFKAQICFESLCVCIKNESGTENR